MACVQSSFPDPKLLITDPDPLMENQELRIRILETIQLHTFELQIAKKDIEFCQSKVLIIGTKMGLFVNY